MRVHYSRTLRPEHLSEVDAIPVTTPARTICDLALEMEARHLREIMARAIRDGLTDVTELFAVMDSTGRTVGASRARRALASLDSTTAASRSHAELRAKAILERAGLPPPQVGWPVMNGGRVVAEVDLAYPDVKVGIEIDGFVWHSSPQQKQRDEDRQNLLVALGWRIVRFSVERLDTNPSLLVRRTVAAREQALRAVSADDDNHRRR